MPTTLSLSAVVPLLGVLIAAALGYLSGRSLETRKQLNLQKGQAYADYLGALATAASDRKAALTRATEAKTRICIYGSARVIEQLSSFEREGAKIESVDSRRIVAQLISLMREDMGALGGRIDDLHVHNVLFGAE